MPFHEFKCPNGHTTERFFKSFSAAEEQGDCTPCISCRETAKKIISVPVGFGLYGNPAGYYKPSATKKHSNKLFHRTKGNGR